ncbi:MAG: TetR/AcrR family transcriptional regulator [Streptococcus parasanguinis]
MADLVTATGLSKGAVYHHFKSKEEILQLLMEKETIALSTFLEELSKNEEVSSTDRLLQLVDYLIGNENMEQLTGIDWAQKIPFGLLFSLKNTVNILSKYVGIIIHQGNEKGEFSCKYPLETATTLSLLIDVWLDPTISGEEMISFSQKLDYIAFYLNSSGVPVLTEKKCQEINKFLLKGGRR